MPGTATDDTDTTAALGLQLDNRLSTEALSEQLSVAEVKKVWLQHNTVVCLLVSHQSTGIAGWQITA